MADSDCIIVHEQVVVPDAAVVEEMVALPGEKGDKGDPFTYDDFTPEQIADLQRPATEAAKVANQAAEKANKAATDIKALGVTLTAEEAKRESAESGRTSAESERAEAEALRETSFSQMQTTLEGLISDTNTATSNANTAAGNAENAATEANNSATLANEAADKATQAAQNVDGRVTSLEGKASQVYENFAAIEASGETNVNKIYIDGETMIPYVYKGGEFVKFNGSITTPSYIEFESPMSYSGRAEIASMTRDENVLYIGQYGGGYIAFDIEANKVIWNTSALNAGRSQQSLVVKGDYLYTIGDSSKRLQKYNKKDGSLILSVTNADTISYNNMYIFVANDNLYFWSYITKTIYLVNEDDLSFADIGKYDGIVESIDFSEYYGIIYTTDNHLIWLDTELNETSNLDTTSVTNISEQTNRIVRCTSNPNFCLLRSGVNNTYIFCIKNNGVNFSNAYCYTSVSIKIGNLLCSCSCEYNSNAINAILSLGILTGRNGLIYSDSSISSLPFVYSSAFNIKNKVYLCYGYHGIIKIQIV